MPILIAKNALVNEITQESFDELSCEAIKELIPKVGPRTLFLKKYKIYKNDMSINDVSDDTLSINNSMTSLSTLPSPTESELEDETDGIHRSF